MKRISLHSLRAAALALAALLAPLAPHAAVITLLPSSPSATAGFPLTLDIRVSGLGAGVALGGFDLDVSFNPGLLSFASAAFGPTLGNPATFDALASAVLGSPGVLDIAEVSLLSPAQLAAAQTTPSLLLATLSFNALNAGTAAFTLLPTSVLSDAAGRAIPITTLTPAIPEPATVLLFSAGLAAVGAARRRRAAG